MTRWQKIGAVVSVLWLIGLPIWLGVHSGNWKTVGHALIVGNYHLVVYDVRAGRALLVNWGHYF